VQVQLAPLLDENVGTPFLIAIVAIVAIVVIASAFKRFVHVFAGVRHCEKEPNDEHG
jgi:hypothetical protein